MEKYISIIIGPKDHTSIIQTELGSDHILNFSIILNKYYLQLKKTS